MDDREDFLKLLLENEQDLKAFIGSLVLDRHVRDDVFQEAALVLWRELDRFDRGRSFGAWARGIAARKILKRREADRRFPVAFSPETIQSVLEAFERTEQSGSPKTDALSRCVEELPEHSRELLSLRYEQELKPPDIALQTGRTLDAVYQALSRVRARLEECIRRRLSLELQEA